MGGTLYEVVTGAAGATYVDSSPVPTGKRRVVLQAHGYHNDAAARGLYGAWGIKRRDGLYVNIQTTAGDGVSWDDGAGSFHGTLGANIRWSLKRPIILDEGEVFSVAFPTLDPAAQAEIAFIYCEWYPEWEPVPWPVNFL